MRKDGGISDGGDLGGGSGGRGSGGGKGGENSRIVSGKRRWRRMGKYIRREMELDGRG